MRFVIEEELLGGFVVENDALRARVAELERQQTETLMFIVAMIQVAGGTVTVPDSVLVAIDRKTMLIREDDVMNHAVTVRIRKP